ncbi:MAG: hypothetical protein KGQ32_06470 [Xanthomonadaceae bacterium]|nr:hypothetical protein [Xanthomonadaceae bacterium]
MPTLPRLLLQRSYGRLQIAAPALIRLAKRARDRHVHRVRVAETAEVTADSAWCRTQARFSYPAAH